MVHSLRKAGLTTVPRSTRRTQRNKGLPALTFRPSPSKAGSPLKITARFFAPFDTFGARKCTLPTTGHPFGADFRATRGQGRTKREGFPAVFPSDPRPPGREPAPSSSTKILHDDRTCAKKECKLEICVDFTCPLSWLRHNPAVTQLNRFTSRARAKWRSLRRTGVKKHSD